MGKFELYTDHAGQSRFRLKAGNGQNILASEWYTTEAACRNGIESVRKNSQIDDRFEKKETEAGHFRFNLKASNGQVIWTSQNYEASSGRDNGIESVQRNAPEAPIEELE
jgi:uncharacterized protein YegP (UPF0339 family)